MTTRSLRLVAVAITSLVLAHIGPGVAAKSEDWSPGPASFLSRDFYSAATYGAHIKGPTEHVIALLKHLGADDVPGIPDFSATTVALGQELLNPPSVAGWAQGQSWITPALIQERGNVAFDFLFPNVTQFQLN